ncbi:MAG: FAD-dependent oxidoreductase [bacterium]
MVDKSSGLMGEPRIGVYVCHCGHNIAGVVDVVAVSEYAKTLPGVVVARDDRFVCSDPGQDLIIKDIKEFNLNRVVIASCSPRIHELTFRNTVKEAGLNQYLFTQVNIREMVSWVTEDPERATEKAKRFVAGGVRRAYYLEPLESRTVPVTPSALIVGGGIAGIEAAIKIAKGNKQVYLVERQPSIGGFMAYLDKTFPTLDCAACILTPRMVDVRTSPYIEMFSYSEVEEVSGYVGNFKVKIRKRARYVDLEKCNACTDCVGVCPVSIPDEFEFGHADRKAIYRLFPQAVPNTFLITKDGVSPCKIACPASTNAHGYIALTSVGKYEEALALVRERLPFPGVLGRVCHHPCEQNCNRNEVDEPLSIAAIKRFLADYEIASGKEYKPEVIVEKRDEKIAIIGAGPAGLTSAQDLAMKGYQVTVFERDSQPGGVMRTHLPDFRLPKDVLDREISYILNLDIDIRTDTPIGKEFTIDNILKDGYKAVIIATGASKSKRLPIPGIEAEGVLYGMDILKEVNQGSRPRIGKKIVVVGGGNVAMDVARTAIRLGAREVSCVCLEARYQMPAHPWEIEDAEDEGVKIYPSYSASRVIAKDGKVIGLECKQVEFVEFDERGLVKGFSIKEDKEMTLIADTILLAIGQTADLDLFKEWGFNITDWGSLEVDPITLATNKKGVFAAGDIVRGPSSIVEAVADGHRASESVDRYINNIDLKEGREPVEPIKAEVKEPKEMRPRVKMPRISVEERIRGFREINHGLSEEMAVSEALRCLNCSICSECNECVKVCQPLAINHNDKDEIVELNVGTIIVSTGYKLMDPSVIKNYGYGKYPDVLTGLEFERLVNAAGFTEGKILTSKGKLPDAVAILHCIGSRDEKHHIYCSRVCCMNALKFAHLVKEKTNAEVYQLYTDIRAFGKGYEEFYKRILIEGVQFIRGMAAEITDYAIYPEEEGRLIIRCEDTLMGKIRRIPVDLVVLCPALEPREDAHKVASMFNIARTADGFFMEKHPKLAPVETANDGVFLAGCCQGPRDIPDTVSQGGAAGIAALSLMDRGEVEIEGNIAVVNEDLCSGCRVCNTLCPFNAIEFDAEKQISIIIEALCKGCGACVSACPSGAITARHFTDQQIFAELEGVLL